MKVKDLIELLSQCNPEAVVLQGGGDVNGYFEVEQIKQVLMCPDVHRDDVNGSYDTPDYVKRKIKYSGSWGLNEDEVQRLEKLLQEDPIVGVII